MAKYLETLLELDPDWKTMVASERKSKTSRMISLILAFIMVFAAIELFFDRMETGIILYRKKDS